MEKDKKLEEFGKKVSKAFLEGLKEGVKKHEKLKKDIMAGKIKYVPPKDRS